MAPIMEERTLADGDIRAIVLGIKEEIAKDFQLEVGRSVLRWFKAAMIGLMIILAVYGFAHANGYSFSEARA